MNAAQHKLGRWGLALLVLLLACSQAMAREIRLQGTVTCKEVGDVGARPARAILVVPQAFVNQAQLSSPEGLYRIDLPASRILDRTTRLHFRNEDQAIGTQSTQIWESQVRLFNDNHVFFVDTAEVEFPCAEAEADPGAMQQQLSFFREEPEPARALLDAGAAGGGAAVLASLPSFGGAAAGGPALPGGVFIVTGLSPSDSKAGQLPALAMSAWGVHPGFNLAPTRNITDASFWNGAALALSLRRAVEVMSDFDEFSRFSIAVPIGERYGVGVGVIRLSQEDRRTATLDIGATHTRSFELKETGVFVSAGVRLNRDADHPLAVGVTLKHLSQDLELAQLGDQVTNLGPDDPSWAPTRQDISKNDMDISLSYQATRRIKLGASVMSLRDRELIDETNTPRSQRAVGAGVSVALGRIHYGVDVIHRDTEGTDLAVGVDMVPFEHGRVALGYDSTFHNASLGLQYYWFTYNYSDDDVFGSTHMAGVSYRF